MKDFLTELRERAENCCSGRDDMVESIWLFHAIEEIERLHAEIERLRKLLPEQSTEQ